MHILALLALLLLPFSVYSQTVYFRADAETGTLSEWTAGGGGYCDQCCNPDQSSNLCVATTEQAHSGTRSFRLDVTNPGSGIQGLKLARWGFGTDPTKGMQLGQTYYFSSWYY